MALMKKDEVRPIQKNIEEILRASERAASLTNQLLAFSRKQVLQPRVLVAIERSGARHGPDAAAIDRGGCGTGDHV
jgi:hypothetical protein